MLARAVPGRYLEQLRTAIGDRDAGRWRATTERKFRGRLPK
jgi:hypothetical protein